MKFRFTKKYQFSLLMSYISIIILFTSENLVVHQDKINSLLEIKFISIQFPLPVWQGQDVAHNHRKSPLLADGRKVDTSIRASLEYVFIDPKILSISTANISHQASHGLLS